MCKDFWLENSLASQDFVFNQVNKPLEFWLILSKVIQWQNSIIIEVLAVLILDSNMV